MHCTICGNEIGENAKFCVHCGAPVVKPAFEEAAPITDPVPAEEAPVFENVPAEEPAPEPIPEPVYQEPVPQPAPVYQEPVNPEPKYELPKEDKPLYDPDDTYKYEEPAPAPVAKADKPLSVWGYLWRMFLFAIPVLGLIPMFVLAFADGINKNSRNFSRAVLICLLILFVIALAGGIALLWMIRDPELIKQYFKNVFESVTTFPTAN